MARAKKQEKETLANETIKRDKTGKFTKGNKGGGRKPIPQDIKQAFIDLCPEAVAKIADIMRTSDDNKLVLDAAKTVLDRAYGKPAQALDIESKNDTTLRIMLEGELEQWSK